MNFSDLFFIYAFLPLCLLCYFISPKLKIKNIVLTVFSLIFYAWGDVKALFLIIIYAILNFSLGRGIEHFKNKNGAKLLVTLGLFIDLGMLIVLKYTGFIYDNVAALFRFQDPHTPSIWVPLGISFFTFRAVSYLLDVYWEKTPAEKYFPDFLLFISLFPCTVAGPIVRYTTIGGELTDRRIDVNEMYAGLSRFCVGLGKKVILADNLITIVDTYMGAGAASLSTLDSWFSVLVYTMYVYFDFSGYSDMAIGLARVFGFHFEENFNYPFMCTSVSEFWQRWHISLGSFFRDYLLYVPIFGKMRRYGGLFLVWFCTGMWHGASWNYIIWGLYFGVFIFIETLLGKKRLKKIPLAAKHIYTKLIIILGFGIFYYTDLSELGRFLRSVFFLSKNGFVGSVFPIYFMNNIFLFLAALICTFPIIPWVKKKAESREPARVALAAAGGIICVAILIVSTILLVGSTAHPFLYRQF